MEEVLDMLMQYIGSLLGSNFIYGIMISKSHPKLKTQEKYKLIL